VSISAGEFQERPHFPIDAVVWALAATTQGQLEAATATHIPSMPCGAAFPIPFSTWCPCPGFTTIRMAPSLADSVVSHFCFSEFDAEGFCENAGPTGFKDSGPTGFEHPVTDRATASANAERAEKLSIVDLLRVK
jgi:hypothetical protein